jgi:hypothetical protein
VENSCSEIFLFLVIFLLQQKPFSNESIKQNENKAEDQGIQLLGSRDKRETPKTPVIVSQQKLIVTPGLNSIFSPNTFLKKNATNLNERFKLLDDKKSNLSYI